MFTLFTHKQLQDISKLERQVFQYIAYICRSIFFLFRFYFCYFRSPQFHYSSHSHLQFSHWYLQFANMQLIMDLCKENHRTTSWLQTWARWKSPTLSWVTRFSSSIRFTALPHTVSILQSHSNINTCTFSRKHTGIVLLLFLCSFSWVVSYCAAIRLSLLLTWGCWLTLLSDQVCADVNILQCWHHWWWQWCLLQ